MTPENGYNPCIISVKGGKVSVSNLSGTGELPSVTPCDGVDVYVNGIKIEEKTTVNDSDEITLKPVCEEEPGSYKIRITPGGLSAVLELKAGTVSRYVIQDGESESDLVLKTTKLVEKFCPFDLTEILREMARKNISYGIKHGEIQAILSRPDDGLYLIAEGDQPGETVNEQVELKFARRPEENRANVEAGRVDFRDLVEIPSVEAGALLAVRHSGVQGNPGRKVTGEIIPPPKPRPLELTGGKGVDIAPDGKKAFARISGRPMVRKTGNRYFIDIDPVLHKKGDVDIASGNLRFKGDIIIYGSVCEGMTVQASGRVNIKGMVQQARIGTQGDIIVGQNITGSNLVAGGNNNFFRTIFKILSSLHSEIYGITGMLPGLARHPKMQDVKTGQLVQILIDKKFPKVPGLINEMLKLSSQNSFILPQEMARLVTRVKQSLSGLNLLNLDSVEELSALLSEIKEVQRVIDAMADNKAGVIFNYAVNSNIEASGDVAVRGSGCINTSVRAGGNVNIKGVFRGGEIIAGGDITMNEAGSELGVKTYIKAGEGRKIFINKAYPGILVQIGKSRSNITKVRHNLKAVLDEEGYIVIV